MAPPKPPQGCKKKQMLQSGLPEMKDPYILAPGNDADNQKDGKTYRSKGNCGTGNGQSLGHMGPISTMNLLCDPGCRMTFYSKSECRSTSSHTLRPSPTSAHTAPRPLPTSPPWPLSTQRPSPIVVTFVRNPSASSHICISTPESILVSDRPYKFAHPGCEKAFT